MKKALVIQHMEHDHIGRFAEYFAEDAILPTTVRPFKGEAMPSLQGFDLMFVLGGAQNTWQEDEYPYLREEKQAIREWVEDRAKPYFGICLGHQLLADALGGTVAMAKTPEVGVCHVTVDDHQSLLRGLPDQLPVMQWHHAEVLKLPESAKSLAQSSSTAVQALQLGQYAFSTQYHCEFTPQAVLGWAAVPNYMRALEDALGPDSHARVIAEAWPVMPTMARETRAMWQNFKRETGL